VCIECKAAECTKKDPCKILAIGAKVLSSRSIYSRVFRHRKSGTLTQMDEDELEHPVAFCKEVIPSRGKLFSE
jgi:hypothetical protein